MEWYDVIIALLGICGTCSSIIFAYKAFKRNDRKDIAEDTKINTAVMTELGYIKSGIDDIKHKLDKHEAQIMEINQKLAVIEASDKQAHKRIDRLEMDGK